MFSTRTVPPQMAGAAKKYEAAEASLSMAYSGMAR